jgi:lipopolysaccharide export LptBFGC system permease protein LptF
MLKVPLWERMILQRLLSQCAAAASVLTALLVMLDFGLQASTLLREIGWGGLPLHYVLVVSKRFPMLASLACVLSCLTIAHQLVKHREWMALVVGGISRGRICRPFWLFCALMGLLIAANSQWLQPKAVDRLDSLEAPQALRMAQITSDTVLLCRRVSAKTLEQPIWIFPHKLVLAKRMDLKTRETTGLMVLERTPRGWERSSAALDELLPPGGALPRWQSAPWAESLPLATLWREGWLRHGSAKLCAITAQRTILCLLPLLATALALPGLIAYRREASWITPMLVGLAAVFVGMTVLEAGSVLSGLGALSCWWSFGLPLGAVMALIGWRWLACRAQ